MIFRYREFILEVFALNYELRITGYELGVIYSWPCL
jgi:hypothetical protein